MVTKNKTPAEVEAVTITMSRECFALVKEGRMKEAYRAETVWLTIRYALAWHDFPEGGQWVDFYEPMNRSDQPMPKVELKLKGEEK